MKWVIKIDTFVAFDGINISSALVAFEGITQSNKKYIIRCPRCLRGYYKVYKVKASSALVAIEGMYKKERKKWNEMEWNEIHWMKWNGMEWVLVKKVMNECNEMNE